MLKFLKDMWNEHAKPNFADNGLFLSLLGLIMFLTYFVLLSPFLLLWGLNDLSKTWFKSNRKDKEL